MKEVKLLFAAVGKAQCGDVICVVVIDHANKTVVTKPQSYKWKEGKLISNYNVATFSVAYVQEEITLPRGFVHEVREFTEEEQLLVKATLTSA